MEDNDEISHSEINRLENLERIVRKFKIVSVNGAVHGGFGKLEPAEDLSTRLSNLESAVNQFGLTSGDVNIAGDFNDGFDVSN